MIWQRPCLAVVVLLFAVAAPNRADDPPKDVQYKGLPGITWQVDSLFGPTKEFTAEFLSGDDGSVRWRMVAVKKVGYGDLLEIGVAQRNKDPQWREAGNYIASFCDENGVAGLHLPISILDAEGKTITTPIPRGDAVYGVVKLPAKLEKIKVVKLR